jgi:hypothetical protein
MPAKKKTKVKAAPAKTRQKQKTEKGTLQVSDELLNQLAVMLQQKLSSVEVAREEMVLFDSDPDLNRGSAPDFRDPGARATGWDARGNITMNTVNDIPFTKENWLAMHHLLNSKIEALANRIKSVLQLQQFSNSAPNGVHRQ